MTALAYTDRLKNCTILRVNSPTTHQVDSEFEAPAQTQDSRLRFQVYSMVIDGLQPRLCANM